jgi:assimilatory nitrate reductase catalytic subunit
MTAPAPARKDEPANQLLRRWQGPLTHDLVLTPGKFGLGQVPARLLPDQTTSMVCGFCSTGCGLKVHLREGEAIGLTPDANYPVNSGMACPKGWEALNVLSAPDRATVPLRRDAEGKRRHISWREALQLFCERFQGLLREHGPESVAFLSTGQIPTEEMALLGCLTKFGMGWKYGDSNTRQCMATAAVAYKQSFGFDAPPYSYADFEQSDCLIFVGANLCVGHPILWERVLRNERRPHIIVIDPRHTETAAASTLHLPIKPKSDQALFYGVAKILIDKGWIDEGFVARHTSGFAQFAAFVNQFPLERVVQATGLAQHQVQELAQLIHESERTSFWWTMGVNQSYQGVRTAQALINLALMTGNIGRPGTGANSITGQCNAMGSRLFSNTSALLGGREFTKAEHRAEVAQILGIEAARIPQENSICYDQILERVREGRIKGLWIIATNTAHSWIQRDEVRQTLEKLDFLVVQDMYHTTETAQLAHLVLPAAGWGEKEGTFINSERRIGVLKKVKRAPGQALADFSIFRLIAEYWGCGEMFRDWSSPEAVFEKLKALSQHRPCDITGVGDYASLDQQGGIQWPWPAGSTTSAAGPAAQRRLFEDGRFFHADGRAKFLFDEPASLPEPPCAEYPLLLLTGRGSAAQWHTQTRTGKSALLRKLSPRRAYVEIHPDDALDRGIQGLSRVLVSSRRGEVTATAFLTATVGRGQVFMPMHYAETNRLTLPHFDPHSRQPSYKDCAVEVRRLDGEAR